MATVEPGDWLTSPYWPDDVQVISNEQRSGYDLLTLRLGDRSAAYVVTSEDWAAVHPLTGANQPHITFTGDPALFRLGVLAHRLRLAHSIDPFAALNSSRIDPLPHQYEAAYEHLLTRPVVRALVAHDAGAGKNMAACQRLVNDPANPWAPCPARCSSAAAGPDPGGGGRGRGEVDGV